MVPEVGVLAWTSAKSRPLISFLVAEQPFLVLGHITARDFSFCALLILSLSLFGNPTAANLPGCRCPVKKQQLQSHLHISRQCDERQSVQIGEKRGDVVF